MDQLKLNLHADGLAAVSLAKSTGETRHYLSGVYVTPWKVNDETGVMMVATDGHVMATYFDRDGEANRPAIIDGAFTSPAMKSGRSEKAPRRLSVDGDIGRVTFFPRKQDARRAVALTLVTEVYGTYPDWRGAVRVEVGVGSAHFAWSHLVMERVCKIAQRLSGPNMRCMDVYMPDPRGPTLFTFGKSCPLSVIAMPMCPVLDDARGSDGWAAVSGEPADEAAQSKAKLAAE